MGALLPGQLDIFSQALVRSTAGLLSDYHSDKQAENVLRNILSRGFNPQVLSSPSEVRGHELVAAAVEGGFLDGASQLLKCFSGELLSNVRASDRVMNRVTDPETYDEAALGPG